ncbi:hypothetical protein LUZ61_006642 [Rhynchospora tenuis]|uniref:Transposase n=1 Tax=Rhynchospora tenuis TaxID=198213 RepID=A0AAD5ZS01_9POAL|nr:hypothetical protein LUZ61_006642 [Rhynchospora tenuis]
MASPEREDEVSEPDLESDDDMGIGIHGRHGRIFKVYNYRLIPTISLRLRQHLVVRYLQGQQRGTSSMRNHIDKKCKKIPRNKPEALQKLLQAKAGMETLVAWTFDQMKCRKCLAKMVVAHEYPFNYKRVFSLVLDNASSNDACISELLHGTSFKDDLQVEGKIFHQRCGCHILNLIVQDGLNCLHKEIDCIRDTMKWIKHSQGRIEKFKLACSQANIPYKKPQLDVPTRWNSTYLMMELAMELKPAFGRYTNLDKKYTKVLNDTQWAILTELIKHFKVFYEATLKLSGSKYPTLNLFFSEFCVVYLANKRMSGNEYPFIVNMGTQMHAKFDKYWSMGNSFLAIACVLDPRCKLDVVQYYMEEMCPDGCDDFNSNLKQCMSELFNEYVEANEEEPSMSKRQKTNVGATSSTKRTLSDRKAGLKDYLKGKKGVATPKSELEDYLSSDRDDASLDDDFDILGWWKMKAPRYPILSKLVRDILAVPISTVVSESAFRTSGRVISQVRNSLSDDTIEALLCCQDWLKASITENSNIIGAPLGTIEEEDINVEGQ